MKMEEPPIEPAAAAVAEAMHLRQSKQIADTAQLQPAVDNQESPVEVDSSRGAIVDSLLQSPTTSANIGRRQWSASGSNNHNSLRDAAETPPAMATATAVATTTTTTRSMIVNEVNVTDNYVASGLTVNVPGTTCRHQPSSINSQRKQQQQQQQQQQHLNNPATTTSAPAPAPSAPAPAMQYTGSIMCRICHNTDRIDRLISPCLCKGTLGFVHRHCLEYWLSRSGILHCELCMHRYKTQTTLRYGCCESARIWFRHPNNRGLLQSDLMVCSLLTIVTFGLVSMSLVGLQYFMLQGNRMGFSRTWTQGSLITFLVIIIVAYVVNICLIIRAQVGPWYRWWRSVRYVRVILPNQLLKRKAETKMRDIVLSPVARHSTDV